MSIKQNDHSSQKVQELKAIIPFIVIQMCKFVYVKKAISYFEEVLFGRMSMCL